MSGRPRNGCAVIPASPSLSFAHPLRVDDLDRLDEKSRGSFETEREGFGDEHHAKRVDGLVPRRETHAGHLDHPLETHEVEQFVFAGERRARDQGLFLARLFEAVDLTLQFKFGAKSLANLHRA